MSRLIGDRLPAPMRFEFGPEAKESEGRCVLLASVCEDGSVRVAVLAASEIDVVDDRHLRVRLQSDGSACRNLDGRGHATLWYVLDAAAYSICGRATKNDADDGRTSFTIEIDSVLQDFRQETPMVGGPTYLRVDG